MSVPLIDRPTQANRLLWRVDVVVVPKEGVNDPEGEAILGGLRSLGYDEARRVRSGRFFTLDIEAEDEQDAKARASRMADQLLANPVIQSFYIDHVSPMPGARGRGEQ
jgi:phosphoribosylformylglycinamidine synthase PurS subunit